MPSWKHPLDKAFFSDMQGKPHWLCNANWFPKENKIVMSKCGSVDREIITSVAHHINDHARKTVAPSLPILLLIDGHSSRNSPQWLDVCHEKKIVVVRLPANTTHILQPCDQSTNKTFQRAVRSTRDDNLAFSHLPYANTAFKIKLAVAGHHAITPDIARKSFAECGLWPMNFQFLAPFRSPQSSRLRSSSPSKPCSDVTNHQDDIASSLSARRENNKLMQRIHNLSDGRLPSERALAEISFLLQRSYRVRKILDGTVRAPKNAPVQVKGGPLRKVSKKAAVLTSLQHKSALSEIGNGQDKSTSTHGFNIAIEAREDVKHPEKENVRPASSLCPGKDLLTAFDDSLDDVPIAQWPKRPNSGSRARKSNEKGVCTQSAARTLLRLSQYRRVPVLAIVNLSHITRKDEKVAVQFL